jgi:hypothetical protein
MVLSIAPRSAFRIVLQRLSLDPLDAPRRGDKPAVRRLLARNVRAERVRDKNKRKSDVEV